MKDHSKVPVRGKTLYYFAAILLPNIFLFFLFNNNRSENALHFNHFLVLAFALSIVSVCVFMFYQKLTRGYEGALAVLLTSWIFFWMFEAIFSIAVKYSVSLRKVALIAGLVIIIAILLYLFRQKSVAIPEYRHVFFVIATTICVLFIYNFVSALYAEVFFAVANPSSDEKPYEVKTNFTVDNSLPRPDVYWFHMDEMMSFDVVEKYFGDPQEELKVELLERGFVINKGAELRAGWTWVAVPALLSPTFFDSYLGARLGELEYIASRHQRRGELDARLNVDGVNVRQDIVPSYELFHAFKGRNYTVVTINNIGDRLAPIDIDYRNSDRYPLMVVSENRNGNHATEEMDNLRQILTSTTPLSLFKEKIEKIVGLIAENDMRPISEYEADIARITERTLGIDSERKLYRRLLDSFSVSSPKLLYATNMIAHCPYNKIYQTGELDNPAPDNDGAVDLLYLPQYKYAAEVMLTTVDMVLERNPDAVIVLQADHGIHHRGNKYMIAEGYPESQILEMNYSVFSAVRIPKKYGGLDKPIDPLNLSRLLVNRFVGENYEMVEK